MLQVTITIFAGVEMFVMFLPSSLDCSCLIFFPCLCSVSSTFDPPREVMAHFSHPHSQLRLSQVTLGMLGPDSHMCCLDSSSACAQAGKSRFQRYSFLMLGSAPLERHLWEGPSIQLQAPTALPCCVTVSPDMHQCRNLYSVVRKNILYISIFVSQPH